MNLGFNWLWSLCKSVNPRALSISMAFHGHKLWPLWRVFRLFSLSPSPHVYSNPRKTHFKPTLGRIPWSTCRSFLQFCKKKEKEEKEDTESIDDFEELEVLLVLLDLLGCGLRMAARIAGWVLNCHFGLVKDPSTLDDRWKCADWSWRFWPYEYFVILIHDDRW